MDLFDKYLTSPGKTDPPLTIFEHSLAVLQVANYLVSRNPAAVTSPVLIRAAALCHDVGKIAGYSGAGKWIHTPHTSKFLSELLQNPRFLELLSSADATPSAADKDLLFSVCESHHYHSPSVLRTRKELILIPIADTLASAICAGTAGNMGNILMSAPYLQVGLELARNLGLGGGLDEEVHRIDLPSQSVPDVLLADMIFGEFAAEANAKEVTPILQREGSLWVVGPAAVVEDALRKFVVDPKRLYEALFEPEVFESILSELPSSGSMQIDSMKYLLVTEAISSKIALSLLTRKKVRSVLERRNLGHLAEGAFAAGLAQGIDSLWSAMRAKLLELKPELSLPKAVAEPTEQAANGRLKRFELGVYANPKADVEAQTEAGGRHKSAQLSAYAQHNRAVLREAVKHDDRSDPLVSDCCELMKLFDAAGNYNRSVTNVLLEYLKTQADIKSGAYSVNLSEVAILDGRQLSIHNGIANAALCPVCRRFRQELDAQALITGNPKSDSVFQMFRRARSQIRVCRWCFLAGYMDLPIAAVTKDGQSVTKAREFLLLYSPLSRRRLQRLVDFVRSPQTKEAQGDVNTGNDEPDTDPVDPAELAELQKATGVGTGYDQLGVLGMSHNRLSNVKGFVLPTANAVGHLVGIRIPVDRLVGEDNVSGAVARELIKATMYDFYLLAEAPSMHYGAVINAPFSVAGQRIELEDMRRANVAYRIASRYGRVGQYRRLSCGLFMLLLSKPYIAVTRLLHLYNRTTGKRLGEDRIEELLDMAQSIGSVDWKFQLGNEIVGTLVEVDLLPKARGFWKNTKETFSGVELTKWLQRMKMARDETTLRRWGTQLINALKAGRIASREFRETRGMPSGPPGEEAVAKILRLVEHIIADCKEHKCDLSELSRDIAEMDYYLLFWHNQKERNPDGAPTSN